MPSLKPERHGAGECRIGPAHRRARKTGPCVPVAVLECATHRRCFTLYPPGHVPYGRQAVAPVALDGSALTVVAADAPSVAQGTCARPPWEQTRFAAVLDAAQGRAWPRDAPGPCWTTQLRRLDELAQLLGLAPSPPAALGGELARLLEVPRLSLLDDAGR